MGHETRKILAHNYEKQYRDTVTKLQTRDDISEANKKLILAFCDDCLSGYTNPRKSKKRISLGAVRKYLFSLQVVARHFAADFDKIDHNDKHEPHIKAFVTGLDSGRIKSDRGKAYSEKSKRDIKISLRKFYKWLHGDNLSLPPCCVYISTEHIRKEIGGLSREEVQYWADRESTIRRQTIILFLYDSGCRAEEFGNVRMQHVTWDDSESCYKLRIEFSKTKPRTIYLPICSTLLKKYISQYVDRDNPQAQLFPVTYDGLRKFLGASSSKILKRRLTAHQLRHGSASFYCMKLNSTQLSYRYGWSLASNMPEVYIDRAGLNDRESSKKVKLDRQDELQEENRRLREDQQIINNTLKEQEKLLRELAGAIVKLRGHGQKVEGFLSEQMGAQK